MRRLWLAIPLLAVLGGLVVWQVRQADEAKKCADYKRRLAAFEAGDVTGQFDTRGDSKAALLLLVAACDRRDARP